MTYVLIDAEGIVQNVIIWNGEDAYDPSPLLLRDYRDGLVIGEPYDPVENVDE